MGDNITAHLQEIAFNTSRRHLRAALLPLLEISPGMKEIIAIRNPLFLLPTFSFLLNLSFLPLSLYYIFV
jgi:hypothetical protein